MVSISPTFYAQIFPTKVLSEAFLYLHFRLELFLAQEYWRKCTHEMLVKLTSGKDLSIRKHISTFWRSPPVCPFHQHFKAVFAPIFLRQKSTNLKFQCEKAVCKIFVQKKHCIKCWWNWSRASEWKDVGQRTTIVLNDLWLSKFRNFDNTNKNSFFSQILKISTCSFSS